VPLGAWRSGRTSCQGSYRKFRPSGPDPQRAPLGGLHTAPASSGFARNTSRLSAVYKNRPLKCVWADGHVLNRVGLTTWIGRPLSPSATGRSMFLCQAVTLYVLAPVTEPEVAAHGPSCEPGVRFAICVAMDVACSLDRLESVP